MPRTEIRVPPVPALVALGIAIWTVIVAAYASVHHGYYVAGALEVGLLILAAALLCRHAARHVAKRR